MADRFEVLKKFFAVGALVVLATQFFVMRVSADYSDGVVINEIAWAGTADNSNDEWIELYNTGRTAVDLSGWKIEDDSGASAYTIVEGEIAPYGFFVIADSDIALSSTRVDAVIGLSLSNAGDSLVLKNGGGAAVDSVNTASGAWYAGSNTTKASMERIDPSESGDDAANWASAQSGNGAKGRSGLPVLGTPGTLNSVYAGASTKVYLTSSESVVAEGDVFDVSVSIDGADDLYAYGLSVSYDPVKLLFIEADESDFLQAGGVNDSFNYGLENGLQGKVIFGNARLGETAGVDGDGELFSMTFRVLSGENGTANLEILAGESFVADSLGDLPASFNGTEIILGESVASSIVSASVAAGDERYTMEIIWQGAADSYLVQRRGTGGAFVNLGTTNFLSFIDTDDITNGGMIVPHLEYEYRITPIKDGVAGNPKTVKGTETRGLKADNDRNDRVDGRDLEKLARSFGAAMDDEKFLALADTNYDGLIDGSDLIDLGINFGLKY